MRRWGLVILLWCLLAPLAPAQTLRRELMQRDVERREQEELVLLEELEQLSEKAGDALIQYSRVRSNIQALEQQIRNKEARVKELNAQIAADAERMEGKLKALQATSLVRRLTPLPGLANMERYLINQELLKYSLSKDAKALEEYAQAISEEKQAQKDLRQQKTELASLFQQRQKHADQLQLELEEQKKFVARLRKETQLRRQLLQEAEAQSQRLARLGETTATGEKGPTPALPMLENTQLLGFRDYQRQLPAPIKGSLLEAYGQSSDPLFKQGLRIKAQPGQVAKAVLHGKIVFAGNFVGLKKMVLVDHGKGSLSLYGNLTSTAVFVGDEVTQGQTLGEPALDATLGAPILYFEIRYKKQRTDPIEWLQTKAFP